jgi:hypothetical protein
VKSSGNEGTRLGRGMGTNENLENYRLAEEKWK